MRYRYAKRTAIKGKYAAGSPSQLFGGKGRGKRILGGPAPKSWEGEQKSRHAMQEFGPGKREFLFCPEGEAVYYKKSWHHAEKFFKNPPNLRGKGVRFRLCPAHQMLKDKQYEGEIVIKNVPAKFRQELLNLVKNFGERAMRRDVLDRILELQATSNRLRVTTSENQLAQKLAQKIHEVFKKKVDFKIFRAKEGEVIGIKIDFI